MQSAKVVQSRHHKREGVIMFLSLYEKRILNGFEFKSIAEISMYIDEYYAVAKYSSRHLIEFEIVSFCPELQHTELQTSVKCIFY